MAKRLNEMYMLKIMLSASLKSVRVKFRVRDEVRVQVSVKARVSVRETLGYV